MVQIGRFSDFEDFVGFETIWEDLGGFGPWRTPGTAPEGPWDAPERPLEAPERPLEAPWRAPGGPLEAGFSRGLSPGLSDDSGPTCGGFGSDLGRSGRILEDLASGGPLGGPWRPPGGPLEAPRGPLEGP